MHIRATDAAPPWFAPPTFAPRTFVPTDFFAADDCNAVEERPFKGRVRCRKFAGL